MHWTGRFSALSPHKFTAIFIESSRPILTELPTGCRMNRTKHSLIWSVCIVIFVSCQPIQSFQCNAETKVRAASIHRDGRQQMQGPSRLPVPPICSHSADNTMGISMHHIAPRSATAAARLLISASFVTQDLTSAIMAAEEVAMESFYCAQALLFSDITNVSADLTDHFNDITSLETNVVILLQRISSMVTFEFLVHQAHLEGLVFESVLLQVAVNEIFRSLCTRHSSSSAFDDCAGPWGLFSKLIKVPIDHT